MPKNPRRKPLRNPYRRYLGINGHSTFNNDPVYGDDAAVLKTFQHLGARWVRDVLSWQQDQSEYFGACSDMGMKLCLTISRFEDWPTADEKQFIDLLHQYAPYIGAVAGMNEPDSGRPRDVWLPVVLDQMRWLYPTIKDDPLLDHITVLPGAIRMNTPGVAQDLQVMYQTIDGLYDYPNAHLYPGNATNVDTWINDRFNMFPAAPWVTEGGASTFKVNSDVQTRDCVALLKACAANGVPFFVYEACDNFPPGQSIDLESYFGIYNSSYQAKPAANALRTMVGMV